MCVITEAKLQIQKEIASSFLWASQPELQQVPACVFTSEGSGLEETQEAPGEPGRDLLYHLNCV